MMTRFFICALGIFLFLNEAKAANPCDIGESANIVENYWPNPSEQTNFIDSLTNNPSCFAGVTSICKVGEINHKTDGYADDHIAHYILLNGKLVFLNTTKYFDQTYGSEWGSDSALLDFIEALRKVETVTGCQF